jgi:hypothetical protein
MILALSNISFWRHLCIWKYSDGITIPDIEQTADVAGLGM